MAISVDVPDGMEEDIESEIERGSYKNKSELIRDAIRRLLEERNKIEHQKLSEEVMSRIKESREQEQTHTLEEAREKLNVS